MKISDDCDLCPQLPDLALKHGYHDMELHGEHNFRLYLGELDCVGCQRKNLGNHAPERPRLCHHYDKFLQVHASGDMLKKRG